MADLMKCLCIVENIYFLMTCYVFNEISIKVYVFKETVWRNCFSSA